jgi:hypothetical protein
MIRVERDPVLCELLNGEVGNLCGWPNFGNKFVSHCASCIYFLLHVLCSLCFLALYLGFHICLYSS